MGFLISRLSKTVAGRIDGARFESFRELEPKGIPEAIEAVAVSWEPLDPERPGVEVGGWPLPEALRVVPRHAYVGARDRAGVARRVQSGISGSRRVVLLSGEPGIGKTRLASYAALGASADGFAVCWGACSEGVEVGGAV